MGGYKRPPKRKIDTRSNGNFNNQPQYNSPKRSEGENELDDIEDIQDKDFDNAAFEATPKRVNNGGGGGGRDLRARNGGKNKKNEVIEILESDEEEEEEDILKQHRIFCEKCQQGHADVLLEAALKKKKRAAGGRGNRKKKQQKDEDEVSEDEAIEALQGWLEVS